MRVTHVVEQGEHLESIAYRYGVSADDIWNDPNNKDLKDDRGAGNVLAPGDLVCIPGVSESPSDVQPETSQEYQANVPKVPVEVSLYDDDGPIANEKYLVRRGADVEEGTTDDQGKVKLTASVLEQVLLLELPDRGEMVQLFVGHLDPADTVSGMQARLYALGYLEHYGLGVNDAYTREALLAFQEDAGLEQSGELDDDTVDKLCDQYGC